MEVWFLWQDGCRSSSCVSLDSFISLVYRLRTLVATNPIDPKRKSALIIQTVMYTLLALVSLLG